MAVFTPVSKADAQELLLRYNLGELVALEGISAGIENTNYFLDTTQGHYVLTLFEVLTLEQLPFYIELMHHLANEGLPVPSPQRLNNQQLITTLHNKPCVIVSRLQGRSVESVQPNHCVLSAQVLASIHLSGLNYKQYQPNLRGLDWWKRTIPQVHSFLDTKQSQLIEQSLEEQIKTSQLPAYQQLPSGPSHCDLFRDNVLFSGTNSHPTMGGVIDFYFAGCDHWLFDVAVTVNDWCIDHSNGEFDQSLLRAWVQAYHAKRPFTDTENQLWPVMLRAAALRFWVSRLYDYHLPREAETLIPHDPGHFEMILDLRSTENQPSLFSYLE
ncbi:MAG TPA: homoserine kinase [Paenalcaligenes sp.]|nr:homoserine kinase [Paenalcaligenes sp.]